MGVVFLFLFLGGVGFFGEKMLPFVSKVMFLEIYLASVKSSSRCCLRLPGGIWGVYKAGLFNSLGHFYKITKLTPQKSCSWEMILSFWWGLFSGLVVGAAAWSTCSHALRKWNKDEICFPNRGHVSTSIACSSISWIPQSWWKKIAPCNSPQFWKFQEQPSSRAARYPPPWVLENKWLLYPAKWTPNHQPFQNSAWAFHPPRSPALPHLWFLGDNTQLSWTHTSRKHILSAKTGGKSCARLLIWWWQKTSINLWLQKISKYPPWN